MGIETIFVHPTIGTSCS